MSKYWPILVLLIILLVLFFVFKDFYKIKGKVEESQGLSNYDQAKKYLGNYTNRESSIGVLLEGGKYQVDIFNNNRIAFSQSGGVPMLIAKGTYYAGGRQISIDKEYGGFNESNSSVWTNLNTVLSKIKTYRAISSFAAGAQSIIQPGEGQYQYFRSKKA